MENVQSKDKGGEQQNQSPKRIKTQQQIEGGGEDRISWLPDCLIVEILSRLPETKQAIRTGTLSKRWQHLWPSLPCLSFDESDLIKTLMNGRSISFHELLPDLYRSIDKTLAQCQSSSTDLNKFQVTITYDNRFKSHVHRWIHFATSRNVRKLDLYLTHANYNYRNEKEQFVLEHDSFFINPHLTHLFFNNCLFNPTGPISWNNLTHLTISFVRLDNDLIANILSGSPLLDTLNLDCCYDYTRVDITSKSIKNLVIAGYEPYDDDTVLEINAPYISSLTIKDELWLSKILLRDVSSLVKAELDYYLRCEEETFHERKMLKRLLSNLRHVKELTMGFFCYKALAYLDAKGILHPSHLKGVDVTSRLYSNYLSKAQVDCCDNNSSDGHSSDINDYVESRDPEETVLDEEFC